MTVVVTQHAVDRYIERIAAVDRDTAQARIAAASKGIEAAGAFGAHAVKTADAKLILQTHRVAVPGGGMALEVRVVTVIARWRVDHSDLNLVEREERFAQHQLRVAGRRMQ